MGTRLGQRPAVTVSSAAAHPGSNARFVIEAAAAGLAYGAGACWVSTCIVASFRPAGLSRPYWYEIPGLRTDTCGVLAFAAAAAGLAVSEYLRLRRARSNPVRPASARTAAALAAAETAAILATALVAYLSVNAVTHPVTLGIRATHFAPWPTEGTLRVVALVVCALAVALLRYVRVRRA